MRKHFPLHGWLGLILIIIFWYINWSFEGFRTHWAFFPLWLGYILTVDSIVYIRKGSSLAGRKPLLFLLLFLISIPGWWLFELLNERTAYWHYLGRDQFTDIEYFLFASLSFSTVIPAIFCTTELCSSFSFIKKIRGGPKISNNNKTRIVFFISGCLMLVLVLVWPEYFPAFLWVSLYFILEPVNAWIGNPTLFEYTEKRDWRPVSAFWMASLICGFFWEMWNYYSYPKWIYTVPYVDFWYIFEMPLLGYLGYLPFALELYVMYHLLMSKADREKKALHLFNE